MSSWEEIADEVAPLDAQNRGLAAGAWRGKNRTPGKTQSLSQEKLHLVSSPRYTESTPLHEALHGRVQQNPSGAFFHIIRAASEFGEEFSDLSVFSKGISGVLPKKANAERLLFVDIETTGLSPQEPLFLIGALHNREGQGAVLEQFLARDFSEERSAVAAFLEIVARKTLVTFNGKRFDWPFIEKRARRYNLKMPEVAGHFDLLQYARKNWKPAVPNCRLQTLELHLCKRKREDDIPSSKIPDQYYDFVDFYTETGSGAHLITPIVHHNIWDVLTMADLLRQCR